MWCPARGWLWCALPMTGMAVSAITSCWPWCAPITNIDIDYLDASNGYSGVYEVRTHMSVIERVRIGNIRARNLAPGGYIGFFKARDIDIEGGDFDPSVRQGYVLYTDAMTRGGTLRVRNQKCKASTSWTSEPFMRLGYTGTVDFSECGWANIELSDWMLDGNNDATFTAISIHGHRASTIRHLVIKDIHGINCPLAEQIYIDLSGHGASTVILDILNVHIFSSAGVPATININDPNGLANGATSAALTAVVPGLAAGDKVEVIAGNINVSVPDVWVKSAGNVGFIVTNRSGSNLSASEPFRIVHHRGNMA